MMIKYLVSMCQDHVMPLKLCYTYLINMITMLNLCIVIAWWDVHKIRSMKLCHVYTHYYPCTTLWWSCTSWNSQLWNYELLILVMWSKVSSLVSFILSSPGGTCTRQFSYVPRAMSCFHDTLSQAMISRIQSVMWLRKTQ